MKSRKVDFNQVRKNRYIKGDTPLIDRNWTFNVTKRSAPGKTQLGKSSKKAVAGLERG